VAQSRASNGTLLSDLLFTRLRRTDVDHGTAFVRSSTPSVKLTIHLTGRHGEVCTLSMLSVNAHMHILPCYLAAASPPH
jgi:hypothetical protein